MLKGPIGKGALVTFPDDHATALDPYDAKNIQLENEKDRSFYISNVASCGASGTVIASMISRTSPTLRHKQVVLDSVRREQIDCLQFQTDPSDLFYMPFEFSGQAPLPAVAADNDVLAAFGRLGTSFESGGSSLLLFDVSRGQISEQPTRKRSRDKAEEQRQITSVPTRFYDAHGLPTKMSCMGINNSGTALICGTESADLYLYR